jgi:hypothetical protein
MDVGAFQNTSITSIKIEAPIPTIPQDAFNGASHLTTVSFTSDVTSIGENAFKDCSALTTVADEGMQNVTTIGEYAFYNCSSLPTLTLAEGITDINQYVFYGCSQLNDIVLPSTITTIDKYAFYQCTSLKCPVFPDGLKTISAYAFYGCTNLGDVTFPAGVTLGSKSYIGEWVFAKSYITSITWPTEAMSINCENCFSGVTGLTELTIPDYMTSIPDETFKSITSLTTLSLPERMSYIGCDAFNGCTSLTGKLTIPIGVSLGYGVTSEHGVFYNTAFTEIEIPEAEVGTWSMNCLGKMPNITSIKFPSTMKVIPAGVCNQWPNLSEVILNGQETISAEAFWKCSKLTSIELPSTLKNIDKWAFAQCSLSSVTLPAGVTVGDYAFAGNPLTAINFPETECYFDSYSFANVYKQTYGFYNPYPYYTGRVLMTSIEFPSWMTTIPVGICYNWKQLQSATYGEQVTAVGDYAFWGCNKLSGMNFDNISNFGAYSFYNCSSTDPKFVELLKLKDGAVIGDHAFDNAAVYAIEFEGCAEFGEDVLKNNPYISSIKFPECMTEIPAGFCSNWTNLDKVVLPTAITKIGKECFMGCRKLTDIEFDADYDYNESMDDVTSGVVKVPATVTDIDKGVFQGTGVSEINWPERVINFGDNTFEDTYVTTATFPDWMTEAPNHIYANCSKLTSIQWDDKITKLGQGMFYNCKALAEDIVIPSTITEIPDSCFMGCTQITKATFPSTLKVLDLQCFKNCTSLSDVSFDEGLTEIGRQAFMNTGLVDVVLPTTLTDIKTGAFANCTSMKTLDVKATDLTLEDYIASSSTQQGGGYGTFEGCTSLETAAFASHLKKLPACSFQNCSSLQTFTYPEDDWIDIIDYYAFQNCASLKSFPYLKHTHFRYNLAGYSWRNWHRAFAGCSSLTQMILPEEYIDCVDISKSDAIHWGDHPEGLFRNATSLQSLIFPFTGTLFHLVAEDINDAPLKGISYSYAQGMKYIDPSTIRTTGTGSPDWVEYKTESIIQYDGNNDYTIASPETSTLYVVRAEKWKYMEAGYGDLFNIIEMKDPRIRLEGDLFSEYDATQNVNHYTVSLRWPMVLSDFNENGETLVDIYREGVEAPVAKIVFSKPSEPKSMPELDANQVVEISYTVNGAENKYTGDFIIPQTNSDGSMVYVMTQATCGPSMYFDAETSKRVGSFDDESSWFAFTDQFDSPVLSEPGVPTSYTYRAVIHSYDYTKLENNDDLTQPAADGLYYHVVDSKTGDLESTSEKMVVPMAIPELSFQGLYSTDDILGNDEAEVEGDEDHHLTACSVDNRDYAFDYVIDEKLTKEQGREYSSTTTQYIITTVTLEELDTEGNVNQIGDPITLSTNASTRSNVGQFAVSDIAVGNRYQTVTHTTFRGTFGSPVITVPGVPNFSGNLSLSFTDHYNEDIADGISHGNYIPVLASIDLTPYLSALGYEDGQLPAEGDYRVAVWRTVPNSSEGDTEELVYFNGDSSVTYSDTNLCTECADLEGLTATEGTDNQPDQLTYDDVFKVTKAGDVEADYTVRIYVKVPEEMLRDDDAWMLVEVPVLSSMITVSGVENVSVDEADEDAIWYDLEGRRVAEPISGSLYIRVTSRGAEKAIYK